ncbi:transposase [candidate division KSB1 bacterium]|nr:transposase [candidate division KSB1 bacterium]
MLRRHRTNSVAGGVHFITAVTEERGSWFVREPICRAILLEFERCRSRLGIQCAGYVLMPDHLHALLMQTEDGDQISELVRAFKVSTARDWNLIRGGMSLEAGHAPLGELRWRRRFDDVAVINNAVAHTMLDYLHANPVKREFVEAPERYLWSSARDYWEIGKGIVTVATDLIGPKLS